MKIKPFYYISFCFGILYLIGQIFSTIMIFHSTGFGYLEFFHTIINGSFTDIITFLGILISSILLPSILILIISLSLIRNKINSNKMMDIAIIMVSIYAIYFSIFIVRTIFIVFSTDSILAMSGTINQFSKIGYLVPVFFFASYSLLTAGYIKEKLSITLNPKKDLGIIFSSLALFVVTLHFVFSFFH